MFKIEGMKGTKIGFLNLLKNLVIDFFLKFAYNESLYYLQYSCTYLMFENKLFPEIWAIFAKCSWLIRFHDFYVKYISRTTFRTQRATLIFIGWGWSNMDMIF